MTNIQEFLPYTQKVKEQNPLVHCITNTITIWDCANILLAAGASPTMAHHPLEVAEITAGCKALVCNLGAMENFDAMLVAAPEAARLGHPIVVDPVGCGGSAFRRERFWELSRAARISCVRGNSSEIKALADDITTVTGVDALPESGARAREEVKTKAVFLARKLNCLVIASGPVDILTDGNEIIEITAGDAMMSRITGSGCMSSALLGAYLAAENSIRSAQAACTIMGYCGEKAAEETREQKRGTMTFHTNLIDQMSMVTGI